MSDKFDPIDKATEILDNNGLAFGDYQSKIGRSRRYDVEKDQPQHFSWASIDVEAPNCSTDLGGGIDYDDAEDMQQQLMEWVRYMVTPDLLQMIRERELIHITLRIGPRALSGFDSNEENGIEISYGK